VKAATRSIRRVTLSAARVTPIARRVTLSAARVTPIARRVTLSAVPCDAFRWAC